MSDPFPYQPPQAPPAAPALPAVEPATPKVFGIMHLVFGGLGILWGAWGIVSTLISPKLMDFGMPSDAQADRMIAAQQAYMNEIAWVGILSSGFALVLAGLLITAGLGLLRKRRSGLDWSNRYAWTSIATKGINMVIAVLVTIPAANRMFDGMMDEAVPGMESMKTVMRVSATVGGILGPLVMMAYPILALVLLNRKPVKDFLEAREEVIGGGAGAAG